MSLRMSKREREEFLAGVHVGVISIAEPGRAPLSAPVWYDFDPARGVSVITGPTSRKGVLLREAGRYSLVAQSEEPPYRYVSVEGPVIEVREADREKDTRPMARRYLGVAGGDAYTDAQPAASDGAVYVMRPERWLTVDYAKLGDS